MFSHKNLTRLFCAWLVLISAFTFAGPAHAASIITVTNANNSGPGSLRQAIIDAVSGDTINFNLTYPATIPLAGQITIDKNLTISGPGAANLTVSGANVTRVFYINLGLTVSISGLTIANGYAYGTPGEGGGIYNRATLTLDNVVFSNSSATTRGGGILSTYDGTLTVKNSTFSANSASGNGGGIYSFSTLSVVNSTFSANTVSGNGGGIYALGALDITNSTFSANSAAAGGGLYNGIATMSLKNTIFANSPSGGDCFNLATSKPPVVINNLIETNAAGANACGTPSLTADPKLGTLGNNGGSTPTFGLLPASPAIDAGDDATCAAAPVNNTSQNGLTRPQGAHCDIGSFELAGDTTPPTVSSSLRAQPSPTSAASVTFRVTFSEPVSGVDPTDFSLTSSGISGASILSVSGSGSIYIVTVGTGTGSSGTIRLNVVDNDSIKDLASNPLGGPGAGNGNYNSGENYTILRSTFADVPVTYWAWQFIERLYSAGISGGCGASPLIFCPETSVTRAEMAVFLLRGIHGAGYTPPPVGASTGFTDVPITHWAAAWIKQFALEGFTNGCGTRIYCPSTPVTRAQAAIFLLRGKHGASYIPPAASGTVFADVPINYWAAAWIERLAAEGYTTGCGGGNYCPDAVVTRAQMAVFLVRVFNLP